MSDNSDSASVGEILHELRQEVRRRRGFLDDSTSSGGTTVTAYSSRELRKSIAEVSDAWYISAHLPVTWNTPIVGRLVSYWKRGSRILLRWYINPIVEQQNAFNAAVARTVRQLAAQQDRLADELQALDERIATLEWLNGTADIGDNKGGPAD